ncbi:MAG: AtpZ/AtpI family protein [Ginsengibacter sp.]
MEPDTNKEDGNFFSNQVAEKEKRKLKALREKNGTVWFGLGMFGMVGWSVAVPSVLGAGLGIWMDKRYPQTFSWTLTFLIIGLFSGSIIAWYWVTKEDKEMHQNKDDDE